MRTLCCATGHRNAWRLSILVDAGTADHSADGVIIPDGLVKRLEDDDTTAFATTETGTTLVKSNGAA